MGAVGVDTVWTGARQTDYEPSGGRYVLSPLLKILFVFPVVLLSGCFGVPGKALVDPPYSVTKEQIVGTWENGVAAIDFASDGTFTAAGIPGNVWEYHGPSGSSITAAGWWQGCRTRESQVRECDRDSGYLRIALSCDYVIDRQGELTSGIEDGTVEPGCSRAELHYQDETLWLYIGIDPNEPRDEYYRFSKVRDQAKLVLQ
ncbi:hypothetical protein [Glycomyces xiaoerkulensis]|uniref:hypothetical protein n=1 Tax=Glycomyces xiaoerkulensis TaxID=2038139 RepID=UPI0012FFD528|nr:hypothetical protein [Glycomyces xiaoerkulensis]